MTMTLESLIEEVGSFGLFQVMLIPLSFSSVVMSVMSMMFMVFGAVEPDWWCASSRDQNNQSRLFFWNSTTGLSEAWRASLPFTYENESDFRNNTTGIVLPIKSCEAVERNDGWCEQIVFSPGMSTVVSEFRLICDLSWVPSLIISAQMAGVLVGAALGGQLADSVGRKTTMVSFSVLHVLFTLIAAFSVSWQMFAVLRALIGSTVGGILVVSFPYPTEFLGARWRALVATIPVWGIGALLYSLLCWALPHWKYLHITIASASLACLPAWIFLPESVRWLAVKGHLKKVHHVLTKMAKWNGRQPPSWSSVQALCSEPNDHSQKKYTYFHIFSTCRMMKVSFLIGYMWFSASLTYYGISFGIKNLSGDFHLNFFLMCLLETPSSLMIYHLTGWLGRRWATFVPMLIVSLSLLAAVPITLILPEDEAGRYTTILCFVARFTLSLAWGTMTLFHAEIYPTVVRNIGLGYCNTVARFGGILAPYILSMGVPYAFYALIGGTMVLSAIAPLLLPETRGKPLPDGLEMTWEEDKGKDKTSGLEMISLNS